jgi:multiple sugar transport system permease protein
MSAETYDSALVGTAGVPVLSAEQRRAKFWYNMRRLGVYAVAVGLALWILVPMWLIGTMALSTQQNVLTFPKPFIPSPISTETMSFFLNTQGILGATFNSIIVAIITLVLSTLIAVPAGYAIARYIFRGRDAIRLGILAVRAFPIVVLAVPIATIYIQLGIYDSPYSLALMHVALTLPTTILVVASVFASVPYELEEAAQVFGSNPIQSFFKIVLPLALPGIAASSLLTFVLSWNEVFAAVMLTTTNRTLPAQILYTLDKSGDPFKFAGAFFMLLPAIVFIFFVRRYLFNMWGSLNK